MHTFRKQSITTHIKQFVCLNSRLQIETKLGLHITTVLAHVHTYVHNWSLQPFSQDYSLVFHVTHVVCINFISEWRDPSQFNVDSERQIFGKLFHDKFIYSQSFC